MSPGGWHCWHKDTMLPTGLQGRMHGAGPTGPPWWVVREVIPQGERAATQW